MARTTRLKTKGFWMSGITIKNNIKFPKIFLRDDLKFIADRIFIPSIQRNIYAQVTLDEKPLPELEPSTVAIKKRKGLRPEKLIAEGKLVRSFFSENKGQNAVIVTLNSDRKDIGGYLQLEGVGKKKKKFNFFGISSRMERDAINYLKKRIKEIIKNGK